MANEGNRSVRARHRSTRTRRRSNAGFQLLAGLLLVGAILASACTPTDPSGGTTTTTPPTTDYTLGAVLPRTAVSAQLPVGATPPASVDLRQWTVPIGDQGLVPSCVTWAIQYAMLGWYSNRQGIPGQPFAPMYAYSQIKQPGGGSYPVDALRVAKEQGTATRAKYPQGDYDDITQPDAAERADAALHQILGYRTLWASPTASAGGEIVQTVIQNHLATQHPVAITIGATDGFFTASISPDAAITDIGSERGRYHEVLAVGYDGAGLIVQNSWGSAWAGDGFARLSWEFVRNKVYEADVIEPPGLEPFLGAPAAPSLASPNGGTRVERSATVDLVANVPSGANAMKIRVTNGSGATVALNGNDVWRSVTATERSSGFHLTFPASALADGTYQWESFANNDGGSSPSSGTRSFTIWTTPLPPAPATLLLPSNEMRFELAGTVDLVAAVPVDAAAAEIGLYRADGLAPIILPGLFEWRAPLLGRIGATFSASALLPGRYEWMVSVKNAVGTTVGSEHRFFSVYDACADGFIESPGHTPADGRKMLIARHVDNNHLCTRLEGEAQWTDIGGSVGPSTNATHVDGYWDDGRRLIVAIGEDRILRAKFWSDAWSADWHRPAGDLAFKLDAQNVFIVKRIDGGLNIYAYRLADSRQVRIRQLGTGTSTSWAVELV